MPVKLKSASLCLLRAFFEPALLNTAVGQITQDSEKALWNLMEHHRVRGFLAIAIKEKGLLGKVSPEITTWLNQQIPNIALDQLVKVKQCLHIAKLFKEEGIDICPLKGVYFALDLYKEKPTRWMSDVDILIRKQDEARAKEILLEDGFERMPCVNRWQTNIYTALKGRESFLKSNCDIDIQSDPRFIVKGQAYSFDAQQAWEQVENRPDLPQNVKLLRAEDALHYQLLNMAEDLERRYLFLYQLMDLAHLIKAVGYPQALEHVRNRKDAKIIKETKQLLLKTAQEVLLDETSLNEMSKDAKQCLDIIFEQEGLPKDVANATVIMKALEVPWLKKAIFLGGYFFPEKDYLERTYGKGAGKLFWGYWRRLWELVRIGVKTAVIDR